MKTNRLLLILFLVFTQHVAFSQVEKYMAAFTYQICKASTWPSQSDIFVIGIVGQSDIIPFFEKLAEEKKIGSQSIRIISWNNANDIKNCQVVFVANEKIAQLAQITKALSEQPVLIITESPGTIKKGAGLSYTIVDNKIRYNLNKTGLLERNVIVHSTIERMALKVY